jgi:ComF family protein
MDLCHDCAAELPLLRFACVHCALPLEPVHDSLDGQHRTCGKCQVKPPAFATAHAVLRFGYPVNRLVQRFKFERDLAVGRMLGDVFADAMLERAPASPDMLIAVPLHRNRERERGFNQSRLLAAHIARRMDLPLPDGMVIRCRDTSEQSGLKAVQRRANLKGAFEVMGDVQHARIALIDDVMTTGTTLNELAATLLSQGATCVDAWVLARTPQR